MVSLWKTMKTISAYTESTVLTKMFRPKKISISWHCPFKLYQSQQSVLENIKESNIRDNVDSLTARYCTPHRRLILRIQESAISAFVFSKILKFSAQKLLFWFLNTKNVRSFLIYFCASSNCFRTFGLIEFLWNLWRYSF